jgi:hypothetical protein
MGEVLIMAPTCQRCKRVECPAIIAEGTVKAIENLLKHLKADICCKVCGSVMMLEKTYEDEL